MWRVFRFALLWVLAVALPFQGAVAATMIACGPSHHGGAAMGEQRTESAHDDHAGAPDGHHAHDAANDSKAGEADHGSSPAAGAKAHKAAMAKCSVCASCCTGAALPSTMVSIDPLPLTQQLEPAFDSRVVVFTTDGPERPPRTFLP